MLFPLRQRLRFSLPVGILVASLGVNATVGAVSALRVAELVTACGRSTVIAANHLETNGAGNIRLAADAFRMTNDFLALVNHYNDGVKTSYLYNGFWGGIDTAAFVQQLQAVSSDAAMNVEPATEQEAEELAARMAQILLCDVLPAIETAAAVAVAVDGMLDKPEHKKLRICLQSLTSLSRTWQVYLANRTTPEAHMYLVPAVAHVVLTLWELFRDLNLQKIVIHRENQKPAAIGVEKPATTTVDHAVAGGNPVDAPVPVASGSAAIPATPLVDEKSTSNLGSGLQSAPATRSAHAAAVVTDITGHDNDEKMVDALERLAEQEQAGTNAAQRVAVASIAPATTDAKASELKPAVDVPFRIEITPPTEEKPVVPVAPVAEATNLLNPPQVAAPVTVMPEVQSEVKAAEGGEKQAEMPEVRPLAVSTASASVSVNASSQPLASATGRVSPRANTPEDGEAIGMDKPTTYLMSGSLPLRVVPQKKNQKNGRGRRG